MSTYTLSTPSTYRITIQGCLDERWSDHFAGMAIRVKRKAGGPSLTVLTGRLVDQAALYGVLNGLYGLGFALLSVERVTTEDSSC